MTKLRVPELRGEVWTGYVQSSLELDFLKSGQELKIQTNASSRGEDSVLRIITRDSTPLVDFFMEDGQSVDGPSIRLLGSMSLEQGLVIEGVLIPGLKLAFEGNPTGCVGSHSTTRAWRLGTLNRSAVPTV